MRLAWLLLLAGCDSLFNLDHLKAPPIDASRDGTIADVEIDSIPAGTTIEEVDGGGMHTCVRAGSVVRCFGFNGNGRLGLGNVMTIGDNEYPRTAPFVNVGAPVLQVATGGAHTCVVTAQHNVRCWGSTLDGRLGYATVTGDIGDDESPASKGDVNVGIPIDALVASDLHTCALGGGAVRCWGSAQTGKLGYGNASNIGDDEPPVQAGNVDVGAVVVQMAAAAGHTCAVTATKEVVCWGNPGAGRLGYGNGNIVGDNESPATIGPVPAGGAVRQVVTGSFHTCVLFDNGTVRCWGSNSQGQLGTANGTNTIYGDNEIASAAPIVDVGGIVTQLAAGDFHTCALLTTGAVHCWGQNTYGQLGYGNEIPIGDDEAPSTAGDVTLGGDAVEISAGGSHTCARLTTGTIRCWGYGANGRLGYGNTEDVGDTEVPSTVGDVPVL
jgi:alpha-tubulin suppressor-like RCC1 family protein